MSIFLLEYHLFRNIIDVAAMDSHNLEPQELNDRIRLYSHKLSQQWGTLQEDTMSVANGNEYFMFASFVFAWNFKTCIKYFIDNSLAGLLKDIPISEADRLLSAAPIADAELNLVSWHYEECIIQSSNSILNYGNFSKCFFNCFSSLCGLTDSKFHTKILCGIERHQNRAQRRSSCTILYSIMKRHAVCPSHSDGLRLI